MIPRVIPCLLLKNGGLVKTVNFKNEKYIGDPINAVKVFNEKEVDELVFLDITKSNDLVDPNYDLLKDISSEAFMPMAYGGGLNSIRQIERIYSIGFEKVIINSSAFENIQVIKDAVNLAGSSGVVVSVDTKSSFFSKRRIYSRSGSLKHNVDLLDHIKKMEDAGAGEILLGSIDKDGTFSGYDLELIKNISSNTSIPVVPVGGAGKLEHFKQAINAGASGVAAGSMFVYHGKHKAVLITYPEYETIKELFN
tara:strand:+ start:1951 stop:2706 length:756 start_codon:yes stop_codon:yes gene_type:complete